jgi:hypothetical protein
MAGRVATLTVSAVMSGVVACGLSVKGSGSDDKREEPTSAQDSTQASEINGAVSRTFSCGSATCTAGTEVCCTSGNDARCHPAEIGCPALDDGGAAATAFQCTSNESCPKHTECCADDKTGSTCQDHCAFRACSVKADTCGRDSHCMSFFNGPLGLGRCVPNLPDPEDERGTP